MTKQLVVKKSRRCLQIIVHKPHGIHGFGDSVTVLYPNEKPDDRFENTEIRSIVKISLKKRGDFDYTSVTRLICALETATDGMPITDLFEQVIRELLIQKGLLKSS